MFKVLEDKRIIQERGDRLRGLRETLRLSRQKFSDKYKIPKGTLQNWEEGRLKGLSEEGAYRISRELAKDNIHCAAEWLLDGIGQPPAIPQTVLDPYSFVQTPIKLSHLQTINQELLMFHHLNANGIDMVISDESMLPFYKIGDLVAGQRYFGEDIPRAVESDCIIQTVNGQLLVRHLKTGSQMKRFDLVAYNPPEEKIFEEIEVYSAAPIVWIRKKHSEKL